MIKVQTIKKLHYVLSRLLIADAFGAFPLPDTMQLCYHMLAIFGTKPAGMSPAVPYRNENFDGAKVGIIPEPTKQFPKNFSPQFHQFPPKTPPKHPNFPQIHYQIPSSMTQQFENQSENILKIIPHFPQGDSHRGYPFVFVFQKDSS